MSGAEPGELTLKQYIAAYPGEIKRELARIPRPVADPWRLWDNRINAFQYKLACEDTVIALWQLHCKVVRELAREADVAAHGDERIAQAGGSMYELMLRMLAQQEAGTCGCERVRRQQAITNAMRTIRRDLAPEGYLEAHVLEAVA